MKARAGSWWGLVLLLGLSSSTSRGSLEVPAGPLLRARALAQGVPSAALEARRADDGGALELPWPAEACLEEGLGAVRAGPAGAAPPLDLRGLTGRGVLVGVIDTGIDWGHPDFAGEAGQPSRLRWVLDLSLPEREGAHPGVDAHGGALYGREEVEAARGGGAPLGSRDVLGHGTHVAGIVGARGGDGLPSGVAPGGELVAVKATRGDSLVLDEDDVLRGVDFVLERAAELEVPVVVHLSLGSQAGPHDGSSAFERALSARFDDKPGRVLVVAAGNDGDSPIHAAAPLSGEVRLPLLLERGAPRAQGEAPGFSAVDVWYAGAQGEVTAELVGPDGRSTGEAGPGEDARDLDPRAGALTLSHAPPVEGRGQVVALIQEPEEGELAPGAYELVLRAPSEAGAVDAWVAIPGPMQARWLDFVEPRVTLAVPGTVEEAVVVGAWVSRDRWASPQGEQRVGLAVGELAAFTGRGPTADGRLKPDLVAPGAVVASSRSSHVAWGPEAGGLYGGFLASGVDPSLPDGRRAVAQGTSVAAPFATGAAALLLEQDPTRTSAQVRALLRTSARPLREGSLWDERAGAGLLDVEAAVRLGAGEQGALASPSLSRAERVGAGRLLVQPRDAQGRPLAPGWALRVELVDAGGREVTGAFEVQRAAYDAWTGEVRVLGGELGGVRARLWVDGVKLDAEPWVLGEEEVERPPARSCAGCAVGSRGGGAWWALAALAWGAGVLRGGRRRRSIGAAPPADPRGAGRR